MEIKAKIYLNTELFDDDSPYGGTAHRGETLKEFLEETYDSGNIEDLDMEEVNSMLKACGIKPIPIFKEDKDFKLYKYEFYDYDDVLWIPEGFTDGSYHNDVCPRATKILNDDEDSFIEINIWQDYKNPDLRDDPDAPRFILDIDVDYEQIFIYKTDDLNEIKKMVEQNIKTWWWIAKSNGKE